MVTEIQDATQLDGREENDMAAQHERVKQMWIEAVQQEGWIKSFVEHVLELPTHEVAKNMGYLVMLETILAASPGHLVPRTVMAQWPDMPDWWTEALFGLTPNSRLDMRRAQGDIAEMYELAQGALRYGLTAK